MKTLVSSLLGIVIIAVIGLGWLAGEIYYRYELSNTSSLNQLQSVDAYSEMGINLSKTLDHSENPISFIDHWNLYSEIELKIQDLDLFSIPQELEGDFRGGAPLTLESENNISIHFFMENSHKVLSFDFPVKRQHSNPSKIRIAFTITFYIGIIVLLLIWIYPLVRDLINLNKSARAFGNGNLATRTASHRFTYIAQIEEEFNKMAERIETLVNDNKLLSRAVSHNLKTPLARLRMGIETIEDCNDPALREKYNKRLENDLCEMESLVDTLLQFAKLEENALLPETIEIDLNAFINELIKKNLHTAPDIEYRPESNPLNIKADPKFLSIALENLIENARQYAKENIIIRTTLEKNNNQDTTISFIIEDDGIGIPGHERENALKPFWRGENGSVGNGHGMGLAIVSRIVIWFNGALIIGTSEELGGAAVTLIFSPSNNE